MSIIIFSIFEIFFTKIKPVLFRIKDNEKIEENVANNIEEINKKDIETKEDKEIEETSTQENELSEIVWQIEIPKINLVAPIGEGTSDEVMNKFVGHFENTEIWNGNVGLAAHNRRISC